MTERIIVEIDDSQLDSVLAKLTTVSNVAKSTTGSANLNQSLPSINRNLRVILGQLPGMRELIQAYFRVRAEVIEVGGGAFSLNFLLATVTTAIILIRQAQQIRKRLDREEEEFRRFVMRTRGFTREELKREQVLLKYSLKGQPT